MNRPVLVAVTSMQSRLIATRAAAADTAAHPGTVPSTDLGPDAGSGDSIDLGADRGQTTAEYALVMLGAAGVAMLLLGWATKSGAIGKLFDLVLDGIVGRVK